MKKKNVLEKEQLPRVTIQMDKPLYIAIHGLAIRRRLKVYEFFNKLIIVGIKEWSKTQPVEDRININAPAFANARRLTLKVDSWKPQTRIVEHK